MARGNKLAAPAAPAVPVIPKSAKSSKVVKNTKPSKGTKGTAGIVKKMSPYNKFMKVHLPLFKAKNPGLSHKEAFVGVAKEWAKAPENPKSVAAK
ncbi:hypothetical protein LPJ66_009846 [Kickxella alabastrina]|uniref:Uncharacterized protein n=1 Tax=Kickxella alabastrina TaxID=61397 RepID=A0ACC1I8B4_9FUNG|nr:hypothetical protein LPJ66_009846 [Kickxella alabastrina]